MDGEISTPPPNFYIQSTSRAAFMSTHKQTGRLVFAFLDKFIPKSELPRLGRVMYHQPFPPVPRKKAIWGRSCVGRGGGWGTRAFRKCRVSPWLWAGFVFRCAPRCVTAWGAMRCRHQEQNLSSYICLSSFAFAAPGFWCVLLLRRLDGGNNGNSKKMSAWLLSACRH